MKDRIPFQKMLLDVPLQVLPAHEFYGTGSFQSHRHDFYMLLWVTKGNGEHEVNFHSQQLRPGRVLFIQQGQVHRVIRQPQQGWMILFQAGLFRQFNSRYPAHEQHGLLDYLNRQPFVDLVKPVSMIFHQLLPILKAAAETNPHEAVIADYLSILLYHANQLFRPLHPFLVHPQQAEKIRQLKGLIERNFRTERTAPFYSEKLGMVTRKLNELTLRLTGKLVLELVNDRLLSEAESLLAGTSLTVKEITFELGFIDHSHFGAYFKRMKGMTASEFRRQQLAHPRA
ncbi:helix-turn-helix transcriptional regulator [Mucilaginibacter sp. dw_454]|uniref:AraC family transcriptional regulator n=1 Tax=Mucilaginibacter sp. dw_454 TaxID=2720079 RepID=UPI001BD50A3B|nr:helix-turn-helix transcriptional regulator [Mucilaginibacter sp. dw_454]